ncbi:Matrixin [Tundrisphaera sp. TA3]|uniref:Matrixin n=1 Tax=Tundrisphaera sp. TA3 TaxID=3435775 RepID=UPI003EBAF6C7
MRRIVRLAFAGFLASVGAARGEDTPTPPPFAEFVVIPIRVHLLSATDLPEVDCRLEDADIHRVLGKVNGIWQPAGIHWGLEALIREPAARQDAFRKAREADEEAAGRPAPLGLLRQLVPAESRGPGGIDVYYVHEFEANGVYLGNRTAFVKDTARLRKVEGGIDEPLPRVTAHELGHALGLAHRQDTFNLLASGTTGTGLNAEEIRTARDKARVLPGALPAPSLKADAEQSAAKGDMARSRRFYTWLSEVPGGDRDEALRLRDALPEPAPPAP